MARTSAPGTSGALRRLSPWRLPFSALTRQIVGLNVVALIALLGGVFYFNQSRASLIEARLASLSEKAEIMAQAIAFAASNPDDPQGLDLQEARQALFAMVAPNQVRAALWLNDKTPIADTGTSIFNGQVIQRPLPPPEEGLQGFFGGIYDRLARFLPAATGKVPVRALKGDMFDRRDVRQALGGKTVQALAETSSGEVIATVAVPVKRFRLTLGALLLASEAGDIDRLVRAERLALLEWFALAMMAIVVLSSILLALRIAWPIRRLAEAASNLDPTRARQVDIPDLTHRHDEIGDLSRALRAMTAALLARIDAIESFAADVAHELKNPLTSLRSAIETLAKVTNEDQRARLVAILLEDIGRIDRLISDISAASRLDAELARAERTPRDLGALLEGVAQTYVATRPELEGRLPVQLDPGRLGLVVPILESRMGQVLRNLIDNALSFSPPQGQVRLSAKRLPQAVELTIEDDGPGIPESGLPKIFDRFYSERPESEAFGGHSGLGLSIVQRIVEAHGGTIRAENRSGEGLTGARFIVTLPL